MFYAFCFTGVRALSGHRNGTISLRKYLKFAFGGLSFPFVI